MNKYVVIWAGAVVFLALLALVFFVSVKPSDSLVKPDVVVRIGYINFVASLPLFVAEKNGYFEDEGVRIETTAIATSNQLVNALVAGNLDCFIVSSVVPVLAVELQSPGRLKVFSVSEITKEAPFDALLIKEDSVITSIADLADKKIGVFPGSTATNLLKKYLSDRGVDITSIMFIPIPSQNQLTALLEGSVDAIHSYEPTTAIAMTRGGIRRLPVSIYAELLSPSPQGVAAVSSSFLDKHPDEASKTIRALERGIVFLKQDDSAARQVLVERMNLPEEAAKLTVFQYMLPHDKISVSTFQEYADILSEIGELSGNVNVSNLLYVG